MYASVARHQVSRRFRVDTDRGSFSFFITRVWQVLKAIRDQIGHEKVLKQPTLISRLKALFKKKDKRKAFNENIYGSTRFYVI